MARSLLSLLHAPSLSEPHPGFCSSFFLITFLQLVGKPPPSRIMCLHHVGLGEKYFSILSLLNAGENAQGFSLFAQVEREREREKMLNMACWLLRMGRVGAVTAKYGEKSVYFDLGDISNTTGKWDLYGNDEPNRYNGLQVHTH